MGALNNLQFTGDDFFADTPQTKSPHWSKDSSVLHARASRRGEQDEAPLRGAGDPVVYWVRTFLERRFKPLMSVCGTSGTGGCAIQASQSGLN
jgi:hypothetical protein